MQSLDATRDDVACYTQSRAAGVNPALLVDEAQKAARATGRGHKFADGLAVLALKEEAHKLLQAGDFRGAIGKYLEALSSIAGKSVVLPTPTVFEQVWLRMDPEFTGVRQVDHTRAEQSTNMDYEKYVDAIALASNIAHCYMKLGLRTEAIDWLQEVYAIMECNRAASMPDPQPTWKLVHLIYIEHWTIRFKMWLRQCTLFMELGNSAVAACCAEQAMLESRQLPAKAIAEFPRFIALRDEFDPWDYFKHRHPEPNFSSHEVKYPDLQVLGVWERQQYAQGSERPAGRMWPSTWIWRGSIYVAGGVTDKGNKSDVEFSDMWNLNLTTKMWRKLPDIPALSHLCGKTSGPMRVWHDKAYHFTGKRKVAVFDLIAEKWDVVSTSMSDGKPWPYHNSNDVSNFTTATMDGVLYVFGGLDGNEVLGNNIFMALDLNTLRWTHLSGTSAHRPKNFEPNLRTNAALWAVPSERKLFLLYGNAERPAAYLKRSPHGSSMDWAYSDFWSFAVDSHTWTRERLRGNFASPRAEMADVYSPALGRAVVYGGYHGSLITFDSNSSRNLLGAETMFHYSYFGDTLLFDPETRKWQLVLVKGFPSYRAASTLMCDPDDGKIYLFGGYTNSEFCPSKSLKTRTYSDLWQLKINMPDGHWNPKDLERDIRAERAGPGCVASRAASAESAGRNAVEPAVESTTSAPRTVKRMDGRNTRKHTDVRRGAR
ncbi:hypothetical protein AURDEDRAFT_150965, partial [Auricularia subglabra TFB-10046 SS5]